MCHLSTVGQRRGQGRLDSNPSRLDIMGHPLFRQLTTRYMTPMDTKTPKPEMPEETSEERERLLSRYSARDHWLIEGVLKAHPRLTAAEAIEHWEAAGSGTGI